MKKSNKVLLGTSAVMALTITGCSADVFNSYAVDADYLQLCRNVENDKRLPSDDCTDSNSDHAAWYYMPLYNDHAVDVPRTGDELSHGVNKIDDDKKSVEVEGDNEDGNNKKFLASSGYGIKEDEEDIKADYVKVCVDQDNNRIDEDECEVDDDGDIHHKSDSSISPAFIFLPMFTNTSTYVPPVGSQVNTKDAVKTLPDGKSSQSVSKNGMANAYTTKGGKTSNSDGKGKAGSGKGGVPRGGFGKGGSVGS